MSIDKLKGKTKAELLAIAKRELGKNDRLTQALKGSADAVGRVLAGVAGGGSTAVLAHFIRTKLADKLPAKLAGFVRSRLGSVLVMVVFAELAAMQSAKVTGTAAKANAKRQMLRDASVAIYGAVGYVIGEQYMTQRATGGAVRMTTPTPHNVARAGIDPVLPYDEPDDIELGPYMPDAPSVKADDIAEVFAG